MKKYLLIVFGQFDEETSKEIGMNLTPIVDSPHLKFQYNKGASILHFASEINHIEIHDFLCGIFYGVATTFILTELTDKVSVNMPKMYSDYLFDLENDSDGAISGVNNGEDFNQEFEDEDYNESFVEQLLKDVKAKVSKPSLDSILDKIKSKGMSSLSEFEKDTLSEYSK